MLDAPIETRLPCPRCRAELPAFASNAAEALCPCGARLIVTVFPAFSRRPSTAAPADVVLEDSESSCFYHARKRATTVCSACGRFLCALCDIYLNGRHICPKCLGAASKKGQLAELEKERVLYDNIVLGLAIAPILMFPVTILTAPAAVVMSLIWWKKPASIMPRTRVRYVLAMIIGSLQIIGWCALLVAGFSD